MLGAKFQFYEESFQPHITSYAIRSELTYMVQFGPCSVFGVPIRMSKNIDIWIHEFVEHSISNILTEYGMPKRIVWIYNEDAECFEWDQSVPHMIAALTGKSGLNGQTVDADTYWDEVIKTYSKRLPFGVVRKIIEIKDLLNLTGDSLCDHY